MVGIGAGHFCGVCIEQPALEIFYARLKRDRPCIDIKVDFIGESARNATLAEFPLRIHGAVEFVRISGKIGVVSYGTWIVFNSRGPGAGNAPLKVPYSA